MVSACHFSSAVLTFSNSLGQLTKILRESHQDFVLEKLIGLFNGTNDELRDVAGLGTNFTSFSHSCHLTVCSPQDCDDKYT